MKNNIWTKCEEGTYPPIGSRVWYASEWIGVFPGTYGGTRYCEFDEKTYHYFTGPGGFWQVDTETFHSPRPYDNEKPKGPKYEG